MMSAAAMGAGQGAYYSGLAREDYYLEGGEPPGQWHGRGAERLGLIGQIETETFKQVFAGFLGGRKLVANAGHINPKTKEMSHRPGWDLSFNAPKSVSVAWSQADQETAQEIRAAHHEAVLKALEYLEEVAGITRRGEGGTEFEEADLVFATFEHGTSRAQDPQLHTHALAMNVSIREDGTTGTVYGRGFFQHKMAAGALYRAELAYQLERRLGLEAIADKTSFRIKGVSEALVDEFSKRRQQILELARQLGIEKPSAKALEKLTLLSRTHKAHAPRGELFNMWKQTGDALGWSTKEIQALVSPQGMGERANLDVAAKLAAAKALEELTTHHSSFTEADLVRHVAQQAQTLGIKADTVLKQTREFLRASEEIECLGMDGGKERTLAISNSSKRIALKEPGQIRFTTKEILALEKRMLAQVERSKTSGLVSVSESSLLKALKERPTIKEEQAEAVRHICQSEGSIKVITGDAGTGKTFMLSATKDALEADGYKLRGACLAGEIADDLGKGTGMKSSTIHSLLWRLENGRETLDEKTVLVIDEAGMVGTRQMAELVERCQESKSTLVLVGDAKQLQAVEMGGAFQEIAKRTGEVRLTEIIRQKDEAEKIAVRAMGEGQAMKALTHYLQEGRLSVADDREIARRELISDWSEAGGMTRPQDNMILCSTNSDATLINREIQAHRKAAGQISEESLRIGETRFHRNDRIIFTKSNASIGIRNNNRGTVLSVNERLNTMQVQLDGGPLRTISLNMYPHVKLAYAATTHKGQGKTTQNAFVLTHEGMQDQHISYVQASRAKHETRIYTTQLEAGDKLTDLARRMSQNREKELALTQQKRSQLAPIPTRKQQQTQTQQSGPTLSF